MPIVEELKKLILARGGSVAGVMTIADACRVLVDLEKGNDSGSDDGDNDSGSDDGDNTSGG